MSLVRERPLRSATWWVGVAIGALMLFMLYLSLDYRPRAVQFTTAIAVAVLIFAIIHSVIGLLRGAIADDSGWYQPGEASNLGRRRAIFGVWGIGAAVLMWVVGLHIALPAFLFLFIGIHARQWLVGLVLAATMWAFSYLLLANTLHILFPASLITRWMIATGTY